MSTPHDDSAPDPEPARIREAVGRFAAGVAHDFNNILTATTGFGQLLLLKLAADDPNRKYAQRILEACDQAARLTRQLLVLGHQDPGQPETFELNAALEQAAPLLRRILEEDVSLDLRCAPGALPVRGDRAQFEQILLGLAAFARGSLPKGGRFTVESAPCVLGAAEAQRCAGLRSGPHVLLAVSDDGPGMDENARARAFEPYFARGRERGLALPTVLALVERCAGHIRLESAPGKGSRFEILFPRADDPLAPSTPIARPPA